MDKIVLITGATRGIGEAIAEKFNRSGYQVIGLASKEKKMLWPILECDLSNSERIKTTFEILKSTFGTPTTLINNAGIYLRRSCLEESLEDFDSTININARATFLLSQIFSLALIEENRTGSIVNISSVSGRIGSLDPAYAASKAAVDAITKSFARELAKANIRVNAVAPGPIETEMGDSIPEERKQKYLQTILQGRFGNAEEIAETAFFLASEKASLITGEVIYATGGML